jgi:hypothetical protein
MNTAGFVEDWVCFAPDTKVWKAPQNRVMFLQVFYKAGKGMGNGATITGVFDNKEDICYFESCSEVNL